MCPATLLTQQEEVEHVLAVVVTAPVLYVSALQTAGAWICYRCTYTPNMTEGTLFGFDDDAPIGAYVIQTAPVTCLYLVAAKEHLFDAGQGRQHFDN